MPGNKPTPRARALGNALREARTERGLDQRSLAKLVEMNYSVISRYETGQRTPSTETVATILAVLGVNGERRDEILDLARGTGGPQWVAASLPEQKQQLAALLDFEREATEIVDVTPLLVTGLLQTPEYARAIMTGGGVPAHEVETRVTVRLGRRQAIERENPVRLTSVLGEAALRQLVGSRRVMAGQLQHLLKVAEWPNVQVRIVPYAAGWYPALEGPFTLIDSKEDVTSVVHLENRRSGMFLHEGPDVEVYRQAADAVLEVAMSPEESTRHIARVLKELET